MVQRAEALGMSESIIRLSCPPNELPSHLYRIHYPQSQTRYITNEGLLAADTTTTYWSMEVFGSSVRRHFTWSYRGRSPFISLFSDKSHAKNWGRKEPWLGAEAEQEDDWCLYSIDTALLEDTVVFKLSRLVNFLGLELPEEAEQHIKGGYICLHKISASAIVEVLPGSDVRNRELLVATLPISKRDITRDEVIKQLEALGL